MDERLCETGVMAIPAVANRPPDPAVRAAPTSGPLVPDGPDPIDVMTTVRLPAGAPERQADEAAS